MPTLKGAYGEVSNLVLKGQDISPSYLYMCVCTCHCGCGHICMPLKLDDTVCTYSYVSTWSGHLLEICCNTIAVKRAWHLLPGVGVAITCLSLHEVFCVTGSDDGYVRIWPRDFLSVFMEIGMQSLWVRSRTDVNM